MVAIRVAPRKVNPSPRTVYRQWVISALRILIGAVFVYAGQAKIQEPAAFAENIASFRLLPSALVNLMAIGLPPFEILLGLLLMTGWRCRRTAFCALLASGVFLLALVSAWMRGIPVECGCFGTGTGGVAHAPPVWLLIGRDLLLLGSAAIVYADAWQSELHQWLRDLQNPDDAQG